MAFKSSGYISPKVQCTLTNAVNSLNHLNSCGDNDSDIDDLHPAALPETTSAGPGSIRGSGRESPEELEPIENGIGGGSGGGSMLQLNGDHQLAEDKKGKEFTHSSISIFRGGARCM